MPTEFRQTGAEVSRPDANRIAMRAVRNILAAAHNFTFELAGKRIDAASSEQPQPTWRPTEGLDEHLDGPWPAPVTLDIAWNGGSSRLQMSCETWSKSPDHRNSVSLSVSIQASGRELLWITVAPALSTAEDGRGVVVAGSVTPSKCDDDEDRGTHKGYAEALRAVVAEAGVPFRSRGYAHLGEIQVPSGEVAPDARTAFKRAVVVAVAKHAWFERRNRTGFAGVPFVEVQWVRGSGSTTVAPVQVQPTSSQRVGKRAGIWPLPGGVRTQLRALQALLEDIQEREPLPQEGLNLLFEERYQVTGPTALGGYKRMLRSLGYTTEDSDNNVELTDDGRAC